jgi:hypothetical protein
MARYKIYSAARIGPYLVGRGGGLGNYVVEDTRTGSQDTYSSRAWAEKVARDRCERSNREARAAGLMCPRCARRSTEPHVCPKCGAY